MVRSEGYTTLQEVGEARLSVVLYVERSNNKDVLYGFKKCLF